MSDPLGALSMGGEPLQRDLEPQQEQRQPGEGVAAAAAATATATAAAAAAAIRSAAAAIRTAAAALPLQPQLRDSPTAAESGRSGSAASLAHPLAAPASPTGSAAAEAAPPPLPTPAERAELFRLQLAAEPAIDLRALRGLAYGGVPDEARGLRGAVWRLLLGLLPPERGQWERVQRRKRAEYAQFCEVGASAHRAFGAFNL